jgi:hypothetical protein
MNKVVHLSGFVNSVADMAKAAWPRQEWKKRRRPMTLFASRRSPRGTKAGSPA